MPSYKDIYRTPLLSAKTLGKEVLRGIIESIAVETIKDPKGETTTRLVFETCNAEYRIALNKGNVVNLAKAWGEDYEKWVGKKVKVTTHATQFMGRPTDGLLVEPEKK